MPTHVVYLLEMELKFSKRKTLMMLVAAERECTRGILERSYMDGCG